MDIFILKNITPKKKLFLLTIFFPSIHTEKESIFEKIVKYKEEEEET